MNTVMPMPSTLAVSLAAMFLLVACESDPADMSEPDATAVVFAHPGITSWSVQLIRDYLETKPWGFFGATCEQWLDIDYEVTQPTATVEGDGRVHVVLDRRADRSLGPESVKYYVDLDSAEVVGDHSSDDGRLGTTEGCDKW